MRVSASHFTGNKNTNKNNDSKNYTSKSNDNNNKEIQAHPKGGGVSHVGLITAEYMLR